MKKIIFCLFFFYLFNLPSSFTYAQTANPTLGSTTSEGSQTSNELPSSIQSRGYTFNAADLETFIAATNLSRRDRTPEQQEIVDLYHHNISALNNSDDEGLNDTLQNPQYATALKEAMAQIPGISQEFLDKANKYTTRLNRLAISGSQALITTSREEFDNNPVNDAIIISGTAVDWVDDQMESLVEFAHGETSCALFSKVISGYLGEGGSGCWFCPIFTAAFDVINNISYQLYNKLAGSVGSVFMKFLGILGAFWLLWIVFQYTITLNIPNTGEFITKLFKAVGTILIGGALLSSSIAFIFDYTINPIINFTSGLTQEVMNSSGLKPSTAWRIEDNKIIESDSKLCTATNPNDSRFYINGNKLPLSSTVYDSMLCMLKTMSASLIKGMAVGATIFGYSFNAGWFGFPDISALLVGFLVAIGFFGVFFIFPWKLIDILVRIGFTAILIPLYVLFWVFPITREYMKKGWDVFISCMFTLLALSILMVIGLKLLTVGVDIDKIIPMMLERDNIKEAIDSLDLSGTLIFVTFAAVYITWGVLSMAPALGAIFNGARMNPDLGNATFSIVAKTTKKGGASIAKAGSALGKKTFAKSGKGKGP